MHIDQLTGGQENARRRDAIGHRCIALAMDGPWSALESVLGHRHGGDDIETYAADAISDILTAAYGVPGAYSSEKGREGYVRDESARERARDLVQRALDSWYGDAEDYVVT